MLPISTQSFHRPRKLLLGNGMNGKYVYKAAQKEASSSHHVSSFLFLAAIAALYVTMSVGRSVGLLVGLLVSNEFQSCKCNECNAV